MSNRPSASLGRRLLPALAVTTAASGLVALLDRPSSGAAVDLGLGSGAVALPDQGAVGAPSQPPDVSSTLPAVVAQQPDPTVAPLVPAAPQPAATAAPTTQPAPAAKPASTACEGQTIDGPTIDTRWGPVQVEAVVSSSGQICDVGAIQYPSSHRKSQQINNYALPILHKQVMKAQSVNINGVSGATITSIGYARSLQAILDQVG
jgi:uncharacterized protein with FMN-binding domain